MDLGLLLNPAVTSTPDEAWFAMLKFQDTCFHHLTENNTASGNQHHLDTIFEVLKVIAYQRHASVAEESHRIESPCKVMDRYMDFNLAIATDKNQFRAFLDKYATILLSFPKIIRNPWHNIYETHSVSHKGVALVGYSSPYTLLEVRGPYYDLDSDDDHFSAFDGLIGLEESRRGQGYTGRLEMTIKGVARQFYANTFGPEIYDDEWDGYGSKEELGSEEGKIERIW